MEPSLNHSTISNEISLKSTQLAKNVEHPKVLNFVLVRRAAKQKFVCAILNVNPHVLVTTNKFFPVTLHDFSI